MNEISEILSFPRKFLYQNVDYMSNWLISKYTQGNVQVRPNLGNYQDDISARKLNNLIFNRAAEGGRGSRIAFGFLNRAAVGWAVSCSAFGLFIYFFSCR